MVCSWLANSRFLVGLSPVSESQTFAFAGFSASDPDQKKSQIKAA
jgi:hypothetical protein